MRTQTGFRMIGVPGIITALHGIVGCGTVTVVGADERPYYESLMLSQVDVDHDIAVLTSREFRGSDAGLPNGSAIELNSLRNVRVLGHPLGVGNMATALTVREVALRPLREHVPPAVMPALRSRNSPNPFIVVLSLQGDLVPGHSGAPILDLQGRVVAVANGGLQGGTVGISWAIPVKDIDLEPAQRNARLRLLTGVNPSVLFEIQQTDLPPLAGGPSPSAHVGGDIRWQWWSTEIISEDDFGGRHDVRMSGGTAAVFLDVRLLSVLDARVRLGGGIAQLYVSEDGNFTRGTSVGKQTLTLSGGISLIWRFQRGHLSPFGIGGVELIHYKPADDKPIVYPIGSWNPDFSFPQQTAFSVSLGTGAATRVTPHLDGEIIVLAQVIWPRVQFIGSARDPTAGAIITSLAIRPARR